MGGWEGGWEGGELRWEGGEVRWDYMDEMFVI